jgi:hypothetical protein
MSSRGTLHLLAWSWFVSGCVGNQNFDDGESELNAAPDKTQASPTRDAGRTLPGSEPAQSEPAQSEPTAASPPVASQAPVVDAGPEGPLAVPTVNSMPPTPDPTLAPPAPHDAGSAGFPQAPIAESLVDSGAANQGGSTVMDSGAALGAGDEGTADAALGSTCEVDACNDHGACIERGSWTLCDCEAAELPTCELPLFREIGPSRNNAELLLVAMSGDGTTLVGAHTPSGSSDPWVGVKWTLEGGLQYLAQDPAGPTVANRVNHDGSLIAGYVEPTAGGEPFDVIWRNGVLLPASEADAFTSTNSPTPTLEELQVRMDDAGIDVGSWDIWSVNAASSDGKTLFGLGISPTYGARWLLRLP